MRVRGRQVRVRVPVGSSVELKPHHRAVGGVGERLDGVELVEHLADGDDAGPHSTHAGGQGAPDPAGQGHRPAHHEHQVEQTHLQGAARDGARCTAATTRGALPPPHM